MCLENQCRKKTQKPKQKYVPKQTNKQKPNKQAKHKTFRIRNAGQPQGKKNVESGKPKVNIPAISHLTPWLI